LFLSYQRQQSLDDRAECAVEAEKENCEHNGHDDNHDGSHHRFAARWPYDFRRFGSDLPDEFAWCRLCHVLNSKSVADSRPAPVGPESQFATIAKLRA
jgi:hypothetical protein